MQIVFPSFNRNMIYVHQNSRIPPRKGHEQLYPWESETKEQRSKGNEK